MARLRNLFVAFAIIALGGLLFGYIIGITGNVVTKGQILCSGDWTGEVGTWTSYGFAQCYKLGALEMGFLSSVNLIGAMLSSLFCFKFSDNMGRKLEVQIGALLYFLGAATAAGSPWLWGVYIGFTIYGLGIGFAMHAAPVYIAEISPSNIRGTMVSAKEAVIVLGIFLGFLLGFIFSGWEHLGWRYMVAASCVVAFAVELGMFFIPESPRFLMLKAVRNGGMLGCSSEDVDKVRASLLFLRCGNEEEVAEEAEAMRSDIVSAVGDMPASVCAPFRYPRPLLIGCGIVFLQQVTGQPSVLYFATNIFKSAGFGETAALSSVGVGVVKLLATLFTVWRVDQYGRRFLLFVGIGMMAAALAVIGTAFLFRECQTSGVSLADCKDENVALPRAWALTTVAGLMVYVSGYQVGFGPIAWVLISEVFPLQARGAALSLAAMVNFGSNILMTLTQQLLQNLLTPAGVFFGYFLMAIVSLFFVQLVVPETRGKTLEEIEKQLAGRKAVRELALDHTGLGA